MRESTGAWLVLLCATLLACSPERRPPARAPERPASVPPQPTAELRTAMNTLTEALRRADTNQLLGCFSDTKPWTMFSTHGVVPADIKLTRAELAHALDTKSQVYAFLFSERPWALRAFAAPPHDAPWVAWNAHQFAPPGVKRGEVWIVWRQEAAKWVVDTLAWPIQ
ncbi:MAG: hypothetical protein ABW321_29280 [Polyangiales bacterium]